MKANRNGNYSKFLIYLVVVILLNVAGITLFFRADLTENRIYSLSDASREVVATLSDPLTVKVFFNSNLPAPYNAIERYLHDLLEEYAISGNKYFNYQFFSLAAEETEEARKNRQLAESYGIHPVQIQAIEQDEVKFQKAYMGLVLIHGDIIEAIPTITDTEGLEYAITSAVRKMNNKISALQRLQGSISVKLILSSSLRVVGPYMNISGLLELPSQVESIVQKLNSKNFGKLSFASLDPSTNGNDRTAAEQYDVLRLNWEEFKDRRGRTIGADMGFAGVVVEHGDKFADIELIEVIRLPLFGTQYQLKGLAELETAIDETIETVININEGIGYLADHGTLPLGAAPPMMDRAQQQGSLSNLNKLLSEEYSIEQVSLKDRGIPDNITTLIIAGAKENFTDYELYQIDQFLMQGRSLALFIDAFSEVNPQAGQGMMNQFQRPVWLPVQTGLEKLLDHYGISVRQSIALDENSFKQNVPRQFGGGERKIYFAPIIKNEMISKEAEFLKNIKGLVMLQASPVDMDSEQLKDSGLASTLLFSSSDRSWEMKGTVNLNPMYINPPAEKEQFGSLPLAGLVEGAFPSYFADKPVPEQPQKDDGSTGTSEQEVKGIDMSQVRSEGETIRQGKRGRIFLIGTSEILKDNVIDGEGKTPNAHFVMNVIDYLNNREGIAVMRSKTQKFNPLKEIAPAARTTIKTVAIAGLPVLIVIAGIIVWGRRSARKRTIQKIFGS